MFVSSPFKSHYSHLDWIQQVFWEKTPQTNVFPGERDTKGREQNVYHAVITLRNVNWRALLSLSDLRSFFSPLAVGNYQQQLQTDTVRQDRQLKTRNRKLWLSADYTEHYSSFPKRRGWGKTERAERKRDRERGERGREEYKEGDHRDKERCAELKQEAG